jgi:predicted amidophosphoribosyltransferase
VELIARKASELTGLTAKKLLEKLATKDQRSLNRTERLKNLEKSFMLKEGAEPLPPHILLLDDVLTTGATLNAATQLLVEHGAREVRCACIARSW